MRLIDADKFKENKEDIARAIDDEPTIAVNCDDCGLLNEISHCCSSCEHLYKKITEEPCCFCGSNNNGHYDKWVPNEYLRSQMKEAK